VGALPVRQKSIICMDRYTTEAYLCVAAHAETYATGSPELLLEDTYSIR
jgi:hypothetical protein